MVLADRTLFVAGSPAGRRLSELAKLAAAQPGVLLAVSADDGSVLASMELVSAPVLDGMAAANGSLYISTTDGNVICLDGQ
jgi:hypothetical protein